ncbi:hypothetical protein [Desulfosporosinus sp. Sb-LF]|uniref:hypothetical protein n=1 Tax=Desulfosporosinus sp. Sb-LF TaxID=2560027 RepID=UPI00107F9D1D|nr:hypothetical protein [Desulfosporosinus sp. Sb-LF]TGE31452.1 hypothetical protein E4K68_17140 [Desulfosporosinus sp. Sb-LF]
MDYNQIENILLSFGLEQHSNSEGTHFTFHKGKKHKIIFERLKPLDNGGAGGYLFAKVLEEYKNQCSKNGHISVRKINSEIELRNLVQQVIMHFDSIY